MQVWLHSAHWLFAIVVSVGVFLGGTFISQHPTQPNDMKGIRGYSVPHNMCGARFALCIRGLSGTSLRCSESAFPAKITSLSRRCVSFHAPDPDLTVQATAAAHCSFYAPGAWLLLGFVLAQSPAAVPDRACSMTTVWA